MENGESFLSVHDLNTGCYFMWTCEIILSVPTVYSIGKWPSFKLWPLATESSPLPVFTSKVYKEHNYIRLFKAAW